MKNRVRQYLKTAAPKGASLAQNGRDNPRLIKMVSESSKIDFIETESEIEALILESQYIKKYKPEFNIVLRDDKQYLYVGFTKEKFPKISLTHQIQNSKFKILNSVFIGPFTDAGALKTTLRLLRKIFPYCTCKQLHHNYCLNYHIGKCIGICCLKLKSNPPTGGEKVKIEIQNSKLKEYQSNIKTIKNILSGKKESVAKQFEKEMKNFASKHEYEKALELQAKIEKLKHVFQNAQIINKNQAFMIYHKDSRPFELLQKVLNLPYLPNRIEAYDVANIQGKYATGAMVVFNDEKPDKNQYRKFKIYTKQTPDDTAMLKEILIRRFNHPGWPYPDLIIVDGGIAQFNMAKKVSKNIPVIALTKNEKHIGYKIVTDQQKEIKLAKLPASLKNIILEINSEAHRFAIYYHRKLHRKSLK